MRFKHWLSLMIITPLLALAGCAEMSNERMGNVIGAGLGGLAGGTFAGKGKGKIATGVFGAVAGWFVGGEIAKYLSKGDKERTGNALENALNKALNSPDGNGYDRQAWRSDTGAMVTVVARARATNPRTHYRAKIDIDYAVCKSFEENVRINHQSGRVTDESSAGVACFNDPAQTWDIVERFQ